MKRLFILLWLLAAGAEARAQINITNVPATNSIPGNAYILTQIGPRTRLITASNLLNALTNLPNWTAAGGADNLGNHHLTENLDFDGWLGTNVNGLRPQAGQTIEIVNAVVDGSFTGSSVGITNDMKDPEYDIAIPRQWRTVSRILITNAIETDSMRVGSFGRLGGNYQLYYGGGGASQLTNYIVLAAGPSLLNLSRVGAAIYPSTSGWDSGQVNGPWIFPDDNGTNYLYYFGGTNYDFEQMPLNIGVAYSTDGTNFTKYSGNPIISHNTKWWNQMSLWSPCVIKNNGTYYLFANGSASTNSHETVGLYTASNPLGPWSEYAGNPVIESDQIMADVSIVKMRDGFLLSAHQLNNTGPLAGLQSVLYWSRNLTNWQAITRSNYISGLPTSPAGQAPQSTRIFMDGGLKMIYDNGVSVFLAVPLDYEHADASILTNASPALATNSATATDGQALVKRGNNLSLETVSGGSSTTGMRTNQFTTNVVGAPLYGPVTLTNLYVQDWSGSTIIWTNIQVARSYVLGFQAGVFKLQFVDDFDVVDILNFNNTDVTLGAVYHFNGSGSGLTGDDEAYGAGWNGDTTLPTKNAVYDKIETLSGGSSSGIATNGGSGQNNLLTNLTVISSAVDKVPLVINTQPGGNSTHLFVITNNAVASRNFLHVDNNGLLYANAAGATNYGGIKIWEGLVSQSGTSAPTDNSPSGIRNSLGTITWARSSVGVYTATISPAGAFTSGKTYVYVGNTFGPGVEAVGTTEPVYWIGSTNTSTSIITFKSRYSSATDAACNVDDQIFNNTEVLIKVFP